MLARIALASLALALIPPSHSLAQTARLNTPGDTATISGHVSRARFSPDGAWIVYEADPWPGRAEIFSVPRVGGGTSVRMNPDLASVFRPDDLPAIPFRGQPASPEVAGPAGFYFDTGGAEIVDFRITEDSSYVVLWIGFDQDFRTEVYARAIDGSGPARRLARGVESPEAEPEGSLLVGPWFVASLEGVLILVAVDGSSVRQPAPGLEVEAPMAATPAGDEIVFWARPMGSTEGFLHVVPIDGSSAPRRLGNPGDLSHRQELWLLPASDRVALRALDAGGTKTLSVPLSGVGPVFDLGVGVQGPQLKAVVTGDGNTLVWRSGGDLLAVPGDGSGPPLLLDGSSVNGTVAEIVAVGPQTVVYRPTSSVAGLRTADVSQGTTWSIDLSQSTSKVVVDGDTLVFSGGFSRVYRTSLAGPGPSQPLTPSGGTTIYTLALTPGGRVAYLRSAPSPGWFRAFDVDLQGTQAPRQLSPEDVTELLVSGEGHEGLLLARQYAPRDLLYLDLATADPAQPRNLPLPERFDPGDVHSFVVSPRGDQVAYVASPDTTSVREVFLVPTDGSVPARSLFPAVWSGNPSAQDVTFSPDGRFVAYWLKAFGVAPRLFLQDVESVGPPHEIPLTSTGTQLELLFAGAGTHLVYLHGGELASVATPFGAPVSLDSHPLLRSPQVTADGLTILYEKSLGQYAVPVNGGAGPVLLPGPVAAMAEDGSRILLILGSGPQRLMSFEVATGGFSEIARAPFLSRVWIGPTFRCAVYASRDASGAEEFHSVPLDGSTPAVLLENFGLQKFPPVDPDPHFSPDGEFVVYREPLGDAHLARTTGSVPRDLGPVIDILPLPDSLHLLVLRRINGVNRFEIVTLDGSAPDEVLPVPEPSFALPLVSRDAGPTLLFQSQDEVGFALHTYDMTSHHLARWTDYGPSRYARIHELALTPDRRSAVLRADHLNPGTFHLYRVDLDSKQARPVSLPVR